MRKKRKSKGVKAEEAIGREMVKTEKKVLRTVMLVIGLITLVFVGYLVYAYFSANYEYNGVKFTAVSDEWVGILYNAKLPVLYEGKLIDYNFYLRKNPRMTVNQVEFDGDLEIKPIMVMNMTGNLSCEGYGVIAMANLATLYRVIGTNTGTAANTTCDSLGRYMYLDIIESDETKIIETTPACYTIKVNNCEILEATERFMIETFVEYVNR